MPEMNDLMKQVDDIVQNFLLLVITGETISEKERELYSLSVQSKALGIPLFNEKTWNELENSSSPYHQSSYKPTKCSGNKRSY